MASFRGHLTFSASLGAVFGALSYWQLDFDWGYSALAFGLTAVGGMLPDLDSDSGVPVREMFGLASVFVPLLLLRRIIHSGLEPEQILAVLGGLYVGIRYGLSRVFKRLTVHRGMFHSIPGMLIAGLLIFLAYQHPDLAPRVLLASAVMIGFFSHLMLDELCSVDFRGLKISLNKYAGSALKFGSPSRWATALTYVVLLLLSGAAFLQVAPHFAPDDGKMNSPPISMPNSEVSQLR